MKPSRRTVLAAGSAAPFAAAAAPRLPDKASFPFEGVYLDAAFTHPLGTFAHAAARAYADARLRGAQAVSPRANARREAVARFARLIGAEPADIAVVPSTLEAENLVVAALDVGPGAGVVTDAGHYDASLVLYGELGRRGTPVAVAPVRNGRVDLSALRARITRDTRLVAVSLVSSATGFAHDLPELCAIAHARGALVYADVIQAAGAVPLNVRASGVDFAACGPYKRLMGDFGAAFLYVRPDRLDRLRRVQVGWRQVVRQPDPLALGAAAPGDYELAEGAAGLFEVSTPAWGALAVTAAALDYIAALGVDAIVRHRRPLLAQLRDGLRGRGFVPLTPEGDGPILAYAVPDAERRFAEPLRRAGVRISTYPDRIRISPSVYNDAANVEALLRVLKAG